MALVLGSCAGSRQDVDELARYTRGQELAQRAPRGPRRVTVRDPFSKVVTEVVEVAPAADGGEVRDGAERLYWPEGTPRSVRHFRGGRPVGIWWSWWRNGALRSAYVHDPARPTSMVWWHANGLLAAEGMALNGRRMGPWSYWHENGELMSQGEMSGGSREGYWTFYDTDGEWTERGRYVGGERLSGWEFRDRSPFSKLPTGAPVRR